MPLMYGPSAPVEKSFGTRAQAGRCIPMSGIMFLRAFILFRHPTAGLWAPPEKYGDTTAQRGVCLLTRARRHGSRCGWSRQMTAGWWGKTEIFAILTVRAG